EPEATRPVRLIRAIEVHPLPTDERARHQHTGMLLHADSRGLDRTRPHRRVIALDAFAAHHVGPVPAVAAEFVKGVVHDVAELGHRWNSLTPARIRGESVGWRACRGGGEHNTTAIVYHAVTLAIPARRAVPIGQRDVFGGFDFRCLGRRWRWGRGSH